MGSGLIYAIVVLVWVAYLVPSWVRHQDQLGSRSVHRYQQAMRVVSKGTEAEILRSPEERMEVRAEMRRRRMIVLATLGGVLLLSIVLAAVGLLALWVPALPLLGGAIYITNVRRIVVAEKVALSRAVVANRAHRTAPILGTSELAATLRTLPRTHTALPPVATPSVPPRTVTVLTGENPTWQPIEVPLPTYVTAPKAVRAHRVIDLTKPGEWTEAQKRAEEARLMAIAPTRDEVFDQIAAEEAVALAERLTTDDRRASGDH
jgi:hypothetical protein